MDAAEWDEEVLCQTTGTSGTMMIMMKTAMTSDTEAVAEVAVIATSYESGGGDFSTSFKTEII